MSWAAGLELVGAVVAEVVDGIAGTDGGGPR